MSKQRELPAAIDNNLIPVVCLAVFTVVWILLAIRPRYRADWFLENLLTFVAVPLAVLTYRRFRFSDRAYVQATLFVILNTIGSHYTYSEVPLGDWMRDLFGLSRNHYDRLVHFSFGLLMLLPIRELAIREPQAMGRFAVFYLSVSAVAFWSVMYEIIEWLVALVADPAAGTAYLGTQGDVWDAQKDMALACAGAVVAALLDRRRLSCAEAWAGDADAAEPCASANVSFEDSILIRSRPSQESETDLRFFGDLPRVPLGLQIAPEACRAGETGFFRGRPAEESIMTKRIIPPAPMTSVPAPDSKVREIVRHLRRVAVVGMSSDLGSPAALDAARLMAYGFQFFPVHSDCAGALGHSCVPHLHDVSSDIDIVQVLPDAGVSMLHLAREALSKRTKVFWIEDAPVDPDVAALLAAQGIQVVAERSLEKEFFRYAM